MKMNGELVNSIELTKRWGIGLTGGIACGKSTVAAMLREEGYLVIDSDQLAREAVEPGSAGLQKIIRKFGEEVLLEDGSLNRKLMGEIVFSDPEKKRALESIVHPAIFLLLHEKLEKHLAADPRPWFYEVPLLFETNAGSRFQQVWAVYCPRETQISRLIARDNIDATMAEKILSNQMPADIKASKADVAIDTDVPMDELRTRVLTALAGLSAETSGRDIDKTQQE